MILLHWLTISDIIDFKQIILASAMLWGQEPSYITELFKPPSSTIQYITCSTPLTVRMFMFIDQALFLLSVDHSDRLDPSLEWQDSIYSFLYLVQHKS